MLKMLNIVEGKISIKFFIVIIPWLLLSGLTLDDLILGIIIASLLS